MKYFKQYPVTLRHFLDKPDYAAVAGYDFNFFDCMAFTADRYFDFLKTRDWLFWLDTEIRELPSTILSLVAMTILTILPPLIFPLFSLVTYIDCRIKISQPMTPIRDSNITDWLRRDYVQNNRNSTP